LRTDALLGTSVVWAEDEGPDATAAPAGDPAVARRAAARTAAAVKVFLSFLMTVTMFCLRRSTARIG
jgi:hypothetical protein